MRSIDPDAFVDAVRNGATVLDVRPTPAAARDAVPGAIHVSVDRIRRGVLPPLESETEIIVVCEWGRVSELAGLYLEARGFTRVSHLTGGIDALRRRAARAARPGTESR